MTSVDLDRRLLLVWFSYLLLVSVAIGAVIRAYVGSVSMWVVIVPAGILILGSIFSVSRYLSWGIKIGNQEILLKRGVLRTKETLVPREQIQHTDVEARIVERTFGLCRVVIYTAGAPRSEIVIPGLTTADAKRIQEKL